MSTHLQTTIATDQQGMTTITSGDINIAHTPDDPRLSLAIGDGAIEINAAELPDLIRVARAAGTVVRNPQGGAVLFNVLLGDMGLSADAALALIDQPDRLLALLARPDQPAPVCPIVPEPVGFQCETVIGHIAGAPVIGERGWERIGGGERRYGARVTLGDLTISTEGRFLNLDGHESDGCDGLPLWVVGRLAELAQSGDLEKLITLARRWCAAD